MIKGLRRVKTDKRTTLSGCTNNNEICLVRIEPKSIFVIQPDRSLRQPPSCVIERYASVVYKDMYTWVGSAYK